MTPGPNPSKGSILFRPVLEILALIGFVSAFTILVMAITGAPPLAACYHLFMGSLGSWVKFTQVIKVWIPLTLCGCGLLFTFRIGLWNIGVEGQVMIGAVFTTWMLRAGVERPEIAPLFIAASLAASALGGALWAGIAGFLKTRGGPM